MPKQKNRSAVKKRFIVLKSGRVKRGQQNHRHLLSNLKLKLQWNATINIIDIILKICYIVLILGNKRIKSSCISSLKEAFMKNNFKEIKDYRN